MKENNNIRELFEKYVSKEINDEEMQTLSSKLKDPHVKKEFELWKEIDNSLKKTDIIELRNQLKEIVSNSNSNKLKSTKSRKTILKNKYSIAAVIILIVVSGFSLYHMIDRNNNNTITDNESIHDTNEIIHPSQYMVHESSIIEENKIKEEESRESKAKDVEINIKDEELSINNNEEIVVNTQYAMNYTESPYLESYIGETRSVSFEIINPGRSARFKHNESVGFNWYTNTNEAITLIILNNNEEEIFNGRIESLPFILEQILLPGLYYWKVETEDDLLYFDKFYVE